MPLRTFQTFISVLEETPAQTADGDPTRGTGCGATIVHPHQVVV